MTQSSNSRYVDYVTSTSFNLTLSKNMVATLASIANKDIHSVGNQLRGDGGYDSTVPTGGSLAKRGLVYHTHTPDIANGESFWNMTEEGWLVVELLKRAGLISDKIKRRKARKVKEEAYVR